MISDYDEEVQTFRLVPVRSIRDLNTGDHFLSYERQHGGMAFGTVIKARGSMVERVMKSISYIVAETPSDPVTPVDPTEAIEALYGSKPTHLSVVKP